MSSAKGSDAEAALAYLAHVSATLATSLDYDRTLAALMRLLVPSHADWASINIRESDGRIKTVALRHRDPASHPEALASVGAYAIDPESRRGTGAVLRLGHAVVDRAPGNEPRPSAFEGFYYRTTITSPLRSRNTIFGTLTLGRIEEPLFRDDDLPFYAEVAQRAAVALDNASLFTTQRTAVERLRFLERASTALASAKDVETTLSSVVRVAAGSVCDWAAIHVRQPDDSIVIASIAHRDPRQDTFAQALVGRHSVDPNARTGSANVMRTGVPELIVPSLDKIREHTVDATTFTLVAQLGFRSGVAVPVTTREGVEGVFVAYWSESERTYGPDDLPTFAELARRCAAAIDTARAETERRRAVARLSLLAETGKVFAESIALDDRLASLTRSLVPSFADWVAIALLDDDKRLQTVAVRHADPLLDAEAQAALAGPVGIGLETELGVAKALREERYDLRDTADGALADASAPVPSLLRRLGRGHTLTVPLTSRGRTYGTLTGAFASSGRHYGSDEIDLFVEIGQRSAMAIENARIYEREHRVAEALQKASLPLTLPAVDGCTFDGVYVPGRSEAQIGGDWYDAFPLRDGRIVISIGDVSGSGLEAAVTMGNVRQIVRGIAQVHADPALMLDAADRALRAEYPDRFVTAFVGVFDPFVSQLAFASAGHPSPMLRHADGSVHELHHRGLPLGLRERDELASSVAIVPPDSLLVLYTDGLTEATRDVIDGEERVREALADERIAHAAHPAKAILDDVLGGTSRDDVAILTMRVAPVESLAQRPPSERLSWRFDSADVDAAQRARREFAGFLACGEVPEDELYAAELVFGELVSNVVRYAPGLVAVTIDWTGTAPVLHVLDEGPGFQHVARLPSDVYSERGRGLFLIASLTEDFHVARRADRGSHARAVLDVHRRVGAKRLAAV
jgi:GAF domain-containing protein/anti-sigma regulatory factor (Ser/Thr protein kinase)